MNCIYPVENKFASHAKPKECDANAQVLTHTPMSNGERVTIVPVDLCLQHSVKVAIDKLSQQLWKPFTDEEIETLKSYGYQFNDGH